MGRKAPWKRRRVSEYVRQTLLAVAWAEKLPGKGDDGVLRSESQSNESHRLKSSLGKGDVFCFAVPWYRLLGSHGLKSSVKTETTPLHVELEYGTCVAWAEKLRENGDIAQREKPRWVLNVAWTEKLPGKRYAPTALIEHHCHPLRVLGKIRRSAAAVLRRHSTSLGRFRLRR